MKLPSGPWTFYIARSFSLLGTSLWQEWYSCDAYKALFDLEAPDSLTIETLSGSVSQYRRPEYMKQFHNKTLNLIQKKRGKCDAALQLGREYHARIQQRLNTGADGFSSLAEAVDFLNNHTVYSVLLPFIMGLVLEEENIPDSKLFSIVAELKSVSYYDRFVKEIITLLVQREMEKEGVENSTEAAGLMTYREICTRNFEHLAKRIQERRAGKLFTHMVVNGSEKVAFHLETSSIIGQLEQMPVGAGSIQGKTAFGGKVVGKVRIVLTNDISIPFEKGDILVASSTNPAIMPLMKKAAAFVTDEGGMLTHAAIVAREMKKPCIVGTKYATRVFKNGDMVEVDANKGIIRKL